MRPVAFLLLALAATSARADVESFGEGALIVPMDVGANGAPPADATDVAYQNYGLLRAFGLVHAWLKDGIAVHWAIDEGKATYDAVDFNADTRLAPGPGTGAGVAHDYRGGPFVIGAADAERARAVLADFNSSCGETVAPFCVHVHEAAASFSTNIARKLIAAPTIGVLIDGNEAIAFRYLNAAGLLTSIETAWPADCTGGACDGIPEVMEEAAVAGCPGANDPSDPGCTPSGTGGALFDDDGDPGFCQLMTMHYVSTAWEAHTQAAVTGFLTGQPTHFYTECDAAKRFENELNLLTLGGIDNENKHNGTDDQINNGSPFAQSATTIQGEGGSLKRWNVRGAGYRPTTEVHVIRPGFAVGESDLWASGVAFGDTSNGKVSMLAGHDYCVDDLCVAPALGQRKVAGVKYFLNSLFEAPCATASGQAVLDVDKSGPSLVDGDAQVTWTIDVPNSGVTAAKDVVVVDQLPAGVIFVSANGGGIYDAIAHTVRWDLGRIAAGDATALTVTVGLLSVGDYTNDVVVTHRVALTVLRVRDSFTTTAINLPPLPSAPAITSPADGSVTQDPAPTVGGTATPGATVDLYVDGALAVSTTADGNGEFSADLPAQADGSYTLTAREVDVIGRPSPPSTAVAITIDTVAPDAPLILSPADGTTTNEDTPTVTGTAEPGATVVVTLDGDVVATVTADTDGGWSYTVAAADPLAAGAHTVEVTATDPAGNTGPAATAGFTVGGGVDTTAPETSIDSGPSSPTDQDSAVFTFSSSEPGSSFECSVDGAAYGACNAAVTLTALADGSHSFRVRATDAAGNTDPTPAVFLWIIDPLFDLDAGPLPDGAVVLPDGAVILPDAGPPGDGGSPDGGLPTDGGSGLDGGGKADSGLNNDGGLPDGAILLSDGAVILPDAGPPADGGVLGDSGLDDDGGGRDRSLPAGVCGNGLLEQGEACDDGNDAAGDGCAAGCAVERGWVCDDFDPSYCIEQENWDHLSIGGGGCGCSTGVVDPSWFALLAVLFGIDRRRRRRR